MLPTFPLSREYAFTSFLWQEILTSENSGRGNSSDPLSSQTLAKDDVVKIHIGAHIDGFAAVTAETIVVGATPEKPVTGRRADVLKAAYTAAEVAMRLVKVGNKNWAVTDAVNKVAAAWGCKAVEGWSWHGDMIDFLCSFSIPQACCHVSKNKTLSMGKRGSCSIHRKPRNESLRRLRSLRVRFGELIFS